MVKYYIILKENIFSNSPLNNLVGDLRCAISVIKRICDD
jgi:hypothetical protein